MNANQAVAGMSLLAAGVYIIISLTGFDVPFAHIIFQWPTILLGIGLVMMWQAFTRRDDSSMFSGVLLTGLGLLFHGGHTFQLWSYDWPYFTLIIGLAFLLKHSIQKRGGLAAGFILLIITAAGVFSSVLTPIFEDRASGLQWILPVVLVLAGLYFLLFGRTGKRTKWK
ncbi:MAG: hypothetical protein EA344_04375 [Alkalicoccus sp.]|nr:MAG: hypothetical protein EA344_04375 [Alkalicoccus sp.]